MPKSLIAELNTHPNIGLLKIRTKLALWGLAEEPRSVQQLMDCLKLSRLSMEYRPYNAAMIADRLTESIKAHKLLLAAQPELESLSIEMFSPGLVRNRDVF